jgi:hypothetical protein
MTGVTSTGKRFRSHVGTGSRSHDYDVEPLSRVMISETVAGAKQPRPGADL